MGGLGLLSVLGNILNVVLNVRIQATSGYGSWLAQGKGRANDGSGLIGRSGC